ncbi:MAG TPA: hypothetical protein VNO30_42730 [Kofleriaceae bacterium]|nr:hypothetical protein [Kofleriaceae bacterium]
MRNVLAIRSASTDPFESYVKQLVNGEKDWLVAQSTDRAEVETQRRRLAQDLFDGAELVDLVGHSTPRSCCLRLGDWVLTPEEAARLASYMPKSVKAVRLIGCSTATTREGRAAAVAFTESGLAAYGTLNKVYTTHFDERGVKLVGGPPLVGFFPDGRGGHETSDAALGFWASLWAGLVTGLRGAAWWTIAVLYWIVLRLLPPRREPRAQIAALLRDGGAAMPGLLTEPLFVFELGSGAEVWTLEILFDFEYARFYASGSAAAERERVYEIRGAGPLAKTPLELYLERAPRGLVWIARHAEAGERCGQVPAR